MLGRLWAWLRICDMSSLKVYVGGVFACGRMMLVRKKMCGIIFRCQNSNVIIVRCKYFFELKIFIKKCSMEVRS